APAPSAEPANDIPPAPIRPAKAPPPPKVKPQEREKRPRKGRAGWEEAFTDEFVRAYPRLTPGQVKAEVSFIEESLGIQYGGVVLDLGCGSGQHAVELASRGFNVVGYDLSLTMLAMAADEAQERGQKINFLQGDMREMAFEEVFDGVFSWATSFGFFDDEINASVIQRVHRALRKGGMFLLDLINRDYICSRLPSLVWFEGDGCVCIDDAQFNSITSRLRVKRTIMIEDGTSKEVEYSIRLYSLHEIGRILHDTGFKVVEVSGHPATHGAFFDADSPRVITLAVRR
ncbi:MAG TPA: methyltransferase domain-containing protein, partial [Polyangiaceae bacterium]|nr:methyltransferase domain-containing protein [Polyangiaceae bacterium]